MYIICGNAFPDTGGHFRFWWPAERFLYPCCKPDIMKNSRKEESHQSKQGHVNTPRPDIRDDMDSRKEKEAGFKENDNKPAKKPKRH